MSIQIKRMSIIKDRQLDSEIENLIRQLPHKDNVVLKDTSGDPFVIKNFSDLYEIDKDTATLEQVVDMLGTLLKKLKELELINPKNEYTG